METINFLFFTTFVNISTLAQHRALSISKSIYFGQKYLQRDGQWINLPNIQTAHAAQQQTKIQLKNGQI